MAPGHVDAAKGIARLGINDLGQEVVLVDVRPGPFFDAPSEANGYPDSVRCGRSRRT
jgi:hypothetical protein